MDELGLGVPSEKLRRQLLEEELKLRKKQPPHWAKTKYRKYALLYRNRDKKENTGEKDEKKPAIKKKAKSKKTVKQKKKVKGAKTKRKVKAKAKKAKSRGKKKVKRKGKKK